MLAIVLFFLAGILCVQQLTILPEQIWILVLCMAAILLVYLKYWHVSAFLAGMLWAIVIATTQLNDRLPEQLAGQDILVNGYITDLPEIELQHARFNFNVISAIPGVPSLVRLTWYYPDIQLKAGQFWQLSVRLKPPHGTLNPGGFDYERWLFVKDIGATGYIRTSPPPKLLEVKPSVALSLTLWRQMLAERINLLKIKPDSLAMIKALTIGDGNSLTQQQWEVFKRTGTTHLMVISGSHVALIAGLVYLLVLKLCSRFMTLPWSPPKVAAFFAVVSAFFYAGLTGFAVPAQRAALMLTLAMLAIVQQRHLSSYRTLGIALLIVLIIDPLVVLTTGFWLSFLAVGLIIYTIAGRLRKPGIILGGIKINWATSLGLAPVLVYFFQQVSLVAPMANLIAVPVVGMFIVPLALLAVLFLLVMPVIGEMLFLIIDTCLQGLWRFLKQLAELPLSMEELTQPGLWGLIFAIFGMLLILAPKGTPSRWLGLIMLLPLVVKAPDKPSMGEAKLTLLDVGQGLAAVVQTAHHVLVYDTGPKFSESNDAGRSIVIPFLRSQGLDKVNTLFISHGDNDHIGGANSLLTEFNVDQLYTSVPPLLAGYSPGQCLAGQTWLWDQVRFTVLSPSQKENLSDNNNSCVLRVQGQERSILLTGDIESEAEWQLVKTYGEMLKTDVLVAPHHGSQTSSSQAFLQAVNPKVILIPSGYRNAFGHPHKEVTESYRRFNFPWLVSANAGAINVELNHALKISSWRKDQGRYWNATPSGVSSQ